MNWKVFLTISLILAGCGGNTIPDPNLIPTTVEVTKFVPYSCGQPPGITHVDFRGVTFELVKPETDIMDEDGAVLFPKGQTIWILTAQEYADLGTNTSIIILASTELKGDRDFWRTCVLDSLKKFNELNTT